LDSLRRGKFDPRRLELRSFGAAAGRGMEIVIQALNKG
jgi:hypothetical protein